MGNIGEMTDAQLFGMHQDFAATEYGAVLAANVRYSPYKPANMPNAAWEELLGPDVNNLRHMPHTYTIARAFVRHMQAYGPDQLSAEDQNRVKLSLITHDEAEAIVSDITYNLKHQTEEETERAAFIRHLPKFHPNAAPEELAELADITETITFNASTPLVRIRAGVEGVGYFKTMLRASQLVAEAKLPADYAELDANLRWMIADVLSNMSLKMTIFAGEFNPIGGYINNQSTMARITRAFVIADEADFTKYGPLQETMTAKYAEAKQVWDDWLRQHGKAALAETVEVA